MYMVITSSGMASWKETKEEAEAMYQKCIAWSIETISKCKNPKHTPESHGAVIVMLEISKGTIIDGLEVYNAKPSEMQREWQKYVDAKPDPDRVNRERMKACDNANLFTGQPSEDVEIETRVLDLDDDTDPAVKLLKMLLSESTHIGDGVFVMPLPRKRNTEDMN